MLTSIEIIVFIALLGFTFYAFFQPVINRIKIIKNGQSLERFDQPLKRIWHGISSFIFLTGSIKKERPFVGIIHAFILFGSLIFDTVSINHILEGLFDNVHINSTHLFIADLFALLVLGAILFFTIRRYVFRPANYTYTTNESVYIYLFLFTVTITFLLYEGAVIARNPELYPDAFMSQFIAGFLPSSNSFVKISWWLHIVNVFAFVAYVPRSKYLHMFTGPVSNGFRNYESKGKLNKLDIEDEDAEVFGIQTLQEFTWKDNLDAFSCIDCGRCDDYCPATNTAKELSPKNIILKLRDNLKTKGEEILNKEIENKTLLMDNIFTESEIWSCTTCQACMEVCPMKIEHVPKIVGLRQGEVLMEGKFPGELKNFFNGINTQGNPWKIDSGSRADWTDELNVPILEEGKSYDYLFFVGCAGSFDDNAKKISKSLVNLLNKAGLSFAILGDQEKCCGETARRIGEEAIGQELINENIEKFAKYDIKNIITACPHCFNTFKNEYPEFGGNYNVIHHTVLLKDLLAEGKLELNERNEQKIIVHDSCYLGRSNRIFEPPRDILKQIDGVEVLEHKMSKEHSFCCGAGGAKFWFEEEGEQINHKRFDMLSEEDPDVIATSCPYCLRMLTDSKNNQEDSITEVFDLAQIIEKNCK